jgi:P2-related tail formation protein
MAQAQDPNIRAPDSTADLLPANATALERDLLTLPQFDAIMVPAAELLPATGFTHMPPEYLLWYVVEQGLAPLLPFFEDVQALYNVGQELMRYRGKIHSLELAASIIGYDISIWEEPEVTVHFPEFQAEIHSSILTPYSLHRLRQLVNFAKPVRGRFRRVFKGLDDRQFVWDKSGWGEFWDMDSGVDLYKTNIVPASDRPIDDPFFVSLGSVCDSEVVLLPTSSTHLYEDILIVSGYSYGFAYVNGPFTFDVDFMDGDAPTTDEVTGALQLGDVVFRYYDAPSIETTPFAIQFDVDFMDAPRIPTIEDVVITVV